MTIFDQYWHGSPAAMSEALTTLGWVPAGGESAVTPPAHILGIVPPVVGEYQGAVTWTALIRSTETLPYPPGVGLVPADMVPDPREALGRVASLSPRVVSATNFLGRFTPQEMAALWVADPRMQAGAMRVMAQGSANLDSEEAHDLIALATALGVLSPTRAQEILQ